VTAQMLPTTLFGARYVDLMLPARPETARLVSGSVISQDRSADAIEIEQVLNNLLPLLTAVQPQQLSLTLTAIAQGLQGRGTKLGQTLVTLNSYLRGLRPHLPALDRDIAELVQVTKTYTQATPDILRALTDFSVVNKTVYQQRANLAALFSTVTTASRDLRGFLDGNSRNIISLSQVSTATLQLLARYSPEFPCTLQALVAFEPNINRVLGAGTDQPGLHIHVNVERSLGRYTTGNAPHYGDNLGPHCYSVPFRGISLNDGAGAATAAGGGSSGHNTRPSTGHNAGHKAKTTSAFVGPISESGLGLANSPAESELVNELAALTLDRSPQSLPDWSSLLVGPLYRGAKVTLK
jgi:phospholipid/cholesterol/gamma-HCH transport system substrate-binding protein